MCSVPGYTKTLQVLASKRERDYDIFYLHGEDKRQQVGPEKWNEL